MGRKQSPGGGAILSAGVGERIELALQVVRGRSNRGGESGACPRRSFSSDSIVSCKISVLRLALIDSVPIRLCLLTRSIFDDPRSVFSFECGKSCARRLLRSSQFRSHRLVLLVFLVFRSAPRSKLGGRREIIREKRKGGVAGGPNDSKLTRTDRLSRLRAESHRCPNPSPTSWLARTRTHSPTVSRSASRKFPKCFA